MESRLDEGRANIIKNAILNDGTFCGSKEWLESHYITRAEFEAFLGYAVQMAYEYDTREKQHDKAGVVETEMSIGNFSGKPGSGTVKFNVEVPVKSLREMINLSGDRCLAYLYPSQMPLDLDGAMSEVDALTGEVM